MSADGFVSPHYLPEPEKHHPTTYVGSTPQRSSRRQAFLVILWALLQLVLASLANVCSALASVVSQTPVRRLPNPKSEPHIGHPQSSYI